MHTAIIVVMDSCALQHRQTLLLTKVLSTYLLLVDSSFTRTRCLPHRLIEEKVLELMKEKYDCVMDTT